MENNKPANNEIQIELSEEMAQELTQFGYYISFKL